MDSSCYLSTCPYKTEHNSIKYMQFSVYQVHTVTYQLSTRLQINIGVAYNETKTVAITNLQCIACQHANGQFCRINAPFQPLAKPPLMCYSPICQKQPGNKGKVFLSNISYAMYIHTYCCYFKCLDHSLKLENLRINNDSNAPRQGQ